MENQIECPACAAKITNLRVINEAANNTGSSMQFVTCDCGERITYWQISAQIRKQKKFNQKFKNWIRSFSHP